MTKRYCIIITCMIAHILFGQDTGARYLIITPDEYVPYLEPLAQWKTQKGMKARIAALSETSSDSSEIKAYIANAYNTWQPRPEYVLFVGSDYHIPFPCFTILGNIVSSDNYYVNVTGDFRNDMTPGRFWAYDALQVQTIIAKVLSYDKEPFLDDSLWCIKGTTIVNEDLGPPNDDSIYWSDARYAHQLMIDAGFHHVDSFSEQRGDSSIDVENAISDGRSYLLFRGTGGNYWGGSFWDIDTLNMHNGYKLPIVISATCATIEGIGQLWMRAGSPSEPKGIVGFYGTTTNLEAAAAFRSALTRGTLESIFLDEKSTLGKAAEAGRERYYEIFGNELEYHSWNCLGDPEMTLRTAIPQPLSAVINSELSTGVCTVFMHVTSNTVPVESAMVCFTAELDTNFYHAGYTGTDGTIQFIDTLYYPVDTISFTATKRNTVPFLESRVVNFTGGPYLVLNSFSLDDSVGGNDDSLVNPGEEIEISTCVKNWGNMNANDVTGLLRPAYPDAYYEITDSLTTFGDIAHHDSAWCLNAFNILIADNCPDSHRIECDLITGDSSGLEWQGSITFLCHSPVIRVSDYYFPGLLKYTTAGDTNQLYIELTNTGSCQADSVTGTLLCSDTFYTAIDSVATFGTIISGGVAVNDTSPFLIMTDPQTPIHHPMECRLAVVSGVYTDTFSFTLYVGPKDYLIWDPDENNTSGPVIKDILDSLNFCGDYMTEFPTLFVSIYRSIFIFCGVYPNNYVILEEHAAGPVIEQYLMQQDGRVYLEGGNVWHTDPMVYGGYDLCPLFGILPVQSSIYYFPGVYGEPGTFTQNMEFAYQGEAYMLDRIDSCGGSQLVFKNQNNYYGCGVAADNRTVGLSFELGCLVDTVPPSTRHILLDSIMDYFGIVPTGFAEYKTSESIMLPYMHITPNPSRNVVRFSIAGIPSSTPSSLCIYDICGRLVNTFTIRAETAQPITVLWDGRDNCGRSVAQGVYITVLSTPDHTLKEKIILLK